jgi:DNA polymerase III epsilon subunit-like protein
MYIFFDTETTGLPRDWNAPISDLDNWPRLVQLAWSRYDGSGNQISSNDFIIKPEGFTIPRFSTAVHRISTEKAEKEGVDLGGVLKKFSHDVLSTKFLIAHNMDFDVKIMGAEFLRKKVENNISSIPKICTMKETVNFCQIEGGPRGYKWPTLSELYYKIFHKKIEGAHDASIDIDACAECFFYLKKKKIINKKIIEEKEEEYIKERNIRLI